MVLIPAEGRKMVSITDHEVGGGYDIWIMGTEVPDDKGKKLLEKYGFLIMEKPKDAPVLDKKGSKKGRVGDTVPTDEPVADPVA